jgi:uncharacterized protein YbjT (DUF2867 family)
MARVFVTGGTGYLGRPLITELLLRRHTVRALVRPGSERKLPAGAHLVVGDALDPASFTGKIPRGATVVHLVGTPHPNPRKAPEFTRVDFRSIEATVQACCSAGARHIVYVSVAHPAPVMQAYIAARQRGEDLVKACGVPATILRPWYVLGPGHWWPAVLIPLYAVLRWLPATRAGADRLALVTLSAMIAALVFAVETGPARAARIIGADEIRRRSAW